LAIRVRAVLYGRHVIETGFVRPDDELLREVVSCALDASGGSLDPARWTWVDHGSANLVVLVDDVAVRVNRSGKSALELLRTQRLVDRIPELPFALPRSLAEPVRVGDLVAIGQQRLHGAPHPSGDGDPRRLRLLLDAVHSVPLEAVGEDLAPARSFMGGSRWFEVMTEQAIPMLTPKARGKARAAADRLATLPSVEGALVHGDLAGANVLWKRGRVSAVLDWDLASADDPAEDVAAVGTWHGWESVARATNTGIVERAKAFAATYSVQLICFAIVNARPGDELDRAIQRDNTNLLA